MLPRFHLPAGDEISPRSSLSSVAAGTPSSPPASAVFFGCDAVPPSMQNLFTAPAASGALKCPFPTPPGDARRDLQSLQAEDSNSSLFSSGSFGGFDTVSGTGLGAGVNKFWDPNPVHCHKASTSSSASSGVWDLHHNQNPKSASTASSIWDSATDMKGVKLENAGGSTALNGWHSGSSSVFSMFPDSPAFSLEDMGAATRCSAQRNLFGCEERQGAQQAPFSWSQNPSSASTNQQLAFSHTGPFVPSSGSLFLPSVGESANYDSFQSNGAFSNSNPNASSIFAASNHSAPQSSSSLFLPASNASQATVIQVPNANALYSLRNAPNSSLILAAPNQTLALGAHSVASGQSAAIVPQPMQPQLQASEHQLSLEDVRKLELLLLALQQQQQQQQQQQSQQINNSTSMPLAIYLLGTRMTRPFHAL